MTQQNFGNLASLGAITLLGFNMIAPQKAQAVIYDVDVSVNSFIATGTLETSGTGDLANGDFSFTDWEVFLDNGSGGAPEATLTPADTAFPTAIFGTLDVGDVVATSSTLSFSNINTSSESQAFGITDSSVSNFFCFGACNNPSQPETVIRIAGVDQTNNGSSVGTNFAVFDAASASVPFEFSPTLGLLAVGGFLGISRLRKSAKSLKLK